MKKLTNAVENSWIEAQQRQEDRGRSKKNVYRKNKTKVRWEKSAKIKEPPTKKDKEISKKKEKITKYIIIEFFLR